MALNNLIGKLLRGSALSLTLCFSNCGGSDGDDFSSGCRNDTDCRKPRVCLQGECVNENSAPDLPPHSQEKDVLPDLCCGWVLYEKSRSDSPKLYTFDFNNFRQASFPEIKFFPATLPETEFSSFRKSLDSSHVVFTKSSLTCCNERILATITNLKGTVLQTVTYVPNGPEEAVVGLSASGDCQLLSNNSSLLAILGEDNKSEGARSLSRAQIYLIEFDGRLRRLTSRESTGSVRSMVIAPGDVVYYSGVDYERQIALWASDINNWSPRRIPLTEAEIFHEMNWVAAKDRILGRNYLGDVYIVDPRSGNVEPLGINTDDPDHFRHLMMVSPEEPRFIYSKGNIMYVYDLISNTNSMIRDYNYPCEKEECFIARQGEWFE